MDVVYFDHDKAIGVEKALLGRIRDDLPFARGKITSYDGDSVYKGDTHFYDDGDLKFLYGRKEIMGSKVSLLNMTALCVTVCHETYGHGIQVRGVYRSNDRLSRVLSTNFYASHASDRYYYGHVGQDGRELYDLYFKQPHEMAAQYVGLVEAYNFMVEYLDARIANDAICEYVNHRIDRGSEFIGFRNDKPYESASDIFDEFRMTFPNVVYAHKNFDMDLAAQEEGSPFAKYRSKNPSYCETISKLENGCDQDARMARIYYKYAGEKEHRVISGMSCFKHNPLSLIVDYLDKSAKSPIGLELGKLAMETRNDVLDEGEDDDSFDFDS